MRRCHQQLLNCQCYEAWIINKGVTLFVLYLLHHHDGTSISWVGVFARLHLERLREELGITLRHEFVDGVNLRVVRVYVLGLYFASCDGVVGVSDTNMAAEDMEWFSSGCHYTYYQNSSKFYFF